MMGGDSTATEGFKRKLTAVFSADVAGYSRLMGEDEAATVKTLETYKEVMFTLIRQHRGRVVDSPGDNVLAEFGSVVDAVQCGVAVQKEFQARNAELSENRRMEFRIGINLGDVIEEKERIYGDGVNIAARLEALADPGGICVSKTAFDQIETKLPLGYEYLGEQTVKNIGKPVGAYKVLMEPRVVVARVKEKLPQVPLWQRKAVLACGLAVLVVLIAFAVWKFHWRTPRMEPASVEKMAYPLPDKPSIAVLPFVNMSDDPKQEYFSDGLTEDLITDLSSISGLFVIARNSTFVYKGKPVKIHQVAEELGVRYVLEGSVRKSNEEVRISAQLIDATTGGHVWAKRYDGKLGDIFALQDSITQKILAALAVKLTSREQEHIEREESYNVAAYDAYLQGLEYLGRHTSDDLTQALSYFERALDLDPNYSATYSAMALTYKTGAEWAWHRQSLDIWWGVLAFVRMRQYLEMALKNPTAQAHRIASEMYLRHRQYEKATAEAERAIVLDLNSPAGHWAMACALIFSGRPEDAIDFVQRARRLDPRSPGIYLMLLGVAHFCMGQLEEAVNLIERGLKHHPEIHVYESFLAASYAHLGRTQEAQAALNNYRKAWGYQMLGFTPELGRVMFVWPFKSQEVADRFASGLLKAGLPGEPSGYYKLSHAMRLTGEEIRGLIFGRTVTGLNPVTGFQWWLDYTEDGKVSSRGPGATETGTDKGAAWIEDDMLFSKWKWSYKGLKFCVSVFRNPEGTSEMKNEYVFVSDYEIFPFSPVN